MGQRLILNYARAMESAADQAALKYLTATGQSARGMLTLFQKLATESIASVQFVDPYVMSHPMPFERIRNLEREAKASPHFNKPDPPEIRLRHDLMQAKLVGFLNPEAVYKRYPSADKSMPARYARAIALFRKGDTRNAVPIIDGLIAELPQNPYFWELKGQALLEGGDPAGAIGPLRKAEKQLPNNGLIKTMLAQALLGTETAANAKAALAALRAAAKTEDEFPQIYKLMALGYGLTNDIPRAELATAEWAYRTGDRKLATEKANIALKSLKRGTPEWLRANGMTIMPRRFSPQARENGRARDRMRKALLAPALAGFTLLTGSLAGAAEFSPAQKDEIGQIVREYLLQNPEILREVMTELEKKQAVEDTARQQTAIKDNAQALFRPEGELVAGNAAGDVTMVEFFDYNCGYCKRALADVMKMIETDGQLRVVLKEFPILGPASTYASKAALASRAQGKYWEYHLALLGHEGHLEPETIIEIAKSVGLDAERLQRDMEAPDVKAIIDRNMLLASALNIQGTPAFIIDSTVIPGAMGYEALAEVVGKVRQEGGCKLC
jgi:protein-disulfide isomerase/Flp pilus assembly protein TadD